MNVRITVERLHHVNAAVGLDLVGLAGKHVSTGTRNGVFGRLCLLLDSRRRFGRHTLLHAHIFLGPLNALKLAVPHKLLGLALKHALKHRRQLRVVLGTQPVFLFAQRFRHRFVDPAFDPAGFLGRRRLLLRLFSRRFVIQRGKRITGFGLFRGQLCVVQGVPHLHRIDRFVHGFAPFICRENAVRCL